MNSTETQSRRSVVSLRGTTFDAAVELLELVSNLHVCQPNEYMKENNGCDACHATRIVAEMREQVNDPSLATATL